MLEGDCRNYAPMETHGSCKAGVSYGEFGGGLMRSALPCLGCNNRSGLCPKYDPYTAKDIDALIANAIEAEKALRKLAPLIGELRRNATGKGAGGRKDCPVCLQSGSLAWVVDPKKTLQLTCSTQGCVSSLEY